MKAVALIPARGGSKGIKNKNIVALGGKPLIGWTIEAALQSRAVADVYVSTDSDAIAEVARQYGERVHVIQRPAQLAQDQTPTDPVIAHAMDQARLPDEQLWVLLQPTSPLRRASHIDEALRLLEQDAGAHGVLSVYEESPSLLKVFGRDEHGYLHGLFGPDAPYRRRQDLPVPCMPNGAIYAFRQHTFREQGGIPRQRMLPYLMSRSLSLDIDDSSDLIEAEHILGAQHE